MNDRDPMNRAPEIARISVRIRCTTKTRQTLETSWSNVGRMGLAPTPQAPLVAALHELGRLAAYFALEEECAASFETGRLKGIEQRAADGSRPGRG